MENSQRIILSGIKDMISSMYKQIHELENKLGEIEIQVDKALGVDSVAASLDFIPVADIEDNTRIEPEMVCDQKYEGKVERDQEYETEVKSDQENEGKETVVESDVKTLLAEELEKDSRPAVMDVMTAKEPWRTDRPGSELKDIRSAISLNDRVLFINYLFGEDPSLFLDTVSAFNSMERLDEAVEYLKLHFPEWDMQSEVVYRFMMAVRRKLR